MTRGAEVRLWAADAAIDLTELQRMCGAGSDMFGGERIHSPLVSRHMLGVALLGSDALPFRFHKQSMHFSLYNQSLFLYLGSAVFNAYADITSLYLYLKTLPRCFLLSKHLFSVEISHPPVLPIHLNE